MATIRQSKSGWVVQVFLGRDSDGKPRFKSRTFHEPHTREGRRQVELEAAKWEVRLDAAGTRPTRTGRSTDRLTVPDLMGRWQASKRDTWSAKHTREVAGRVDRYVIPAFTDTPVAEVSREMVADFYDTLDLAPGTIRTIHAALSGAWTWGESEGLVKAHPIRQVTPPRQRRKQANRCPPDELIRAVLADETVDPRWRAMFRLAAVSAIRPGEMCALRWHDLRGSQLTVHDALSDGELATTKTGEARMVTLDPEVIEAIELWRSIQAAASTRVEQPVKQSGFMFSVHPGATRPLRPDSITQWWDRNRERWDGQAWRFYDLRHWATTRLLESGLSPAVVAARNGHDPEVLIRHYAHAIPDDGSMSKYLSGLIGS